MPPATQTRPTAPPPAPLGRGLRGTRAGLAEQLVERLDAARTRTVRLAEAAGCRFVAPPAGLFGWVDVGCDTEALAQPLLDDGWLTAPGMLFHATPRSTTLMRVNFASADEPRFWQRLAALRRTRSAVQPC
jgi:DNA-binding transcriptional MocR family regulator